MKNNLFPDYLLLTLLDQYLYFRNPPPETRFTPEELHFHRRKSISNYFKIKRQQAKKTLTNAE